MFNLFSSPSELEALGAHDDPVYQQMVESGQMAEVESTQGWDLEWIERHREGGDLYEAPQILNPGDMDEMEMQHWEAAGFEFAGRNEPYDGSEDPPFVHDPDFQLPEGF